MKVEGSVVLLTGANGGIGRAFVKALLARGASKIYLGVRNPASVQDLVSGSDKLVAIELDLGAPNQIAQAARTASDINLLINNAGTAAFSGALSARDTTGARAEMEANYFGVLALSQALRDTPAFRAGGAIVNILSVLSHITLPVAGTYSASKAAALHLTRTLRAELKSRGVQVLAVLPAQTDTAMGAARPQAQTRSSPANCLRRPPTHSRLIPKACKPNWHSSFTQSAESSRYPQCRSASHEEENRIDHWRVLRHWRGHCENAGRRRPPRIRRRA